IYKTSTNELFHISNGRIFRALTHIKGSSFHVINEEMARSAGFILGNFHRALMGFNYDYQSKRRHGGDYAFHQSQLLQALNRHKHHEYFMRVLLFSEVMIPEIERLSSNLNTTKRHVHGDPKISNILFD